MLASCEHSAPTLLRPLAIPLLIGGLMTGGAALKTRERPAATPARALDSHHGTALRAPWALPEDAVDPFSWGAPLAGAVTSLHVSQMATYIDFFGKRMCLPGYAPDGCTARLAVANPWYTADCPNLQNVLGNTLDVSTPEVGLGGRVGCAGALQVPTGEITPCAYLCYSHPQYGTAIVPHALWRRAQLDERGWAEAVGKHGITDDRSAEHWEGFRGFVDVPAVLGEGSLLEVGAGPWTQTKGLLFKRPDLKIQRFAIFEPSADWYEANVNTCSYKTGKLRTFNHTSEGKYYHDFPMEIFGRSGESLLQHEGRYDALVCTNVIEHVQNAFAFLQGLHRVLKPGGVLIFHERFYDSPPSADPLLGAGTLHPIRLTKMVFDQFLQQFHPLLKNDKPTTRMVQAALGEKGYYFIGTKK